MKTRKNLILIALFGDVDYSSDTCSGEKKSYIFHPRKSVHLMSDAEQEEPNEISLSVDWHIPESIHSKYANNTLVQAGRFEFVISFFEIQLPVLLGSPEENKEKLKEMGKIRAECVSKVVLPPEVISGLINALQVEWEKFQSQRSSQ